jgi:carbon storage regulator
MLVLARHVDEEIIIDGGIRIKVLEIQGGQVRLGIEAPRELGVYRKEVYDLIAEANKEATSADPSKLGRALGKK